MAIVMIGWCQERNKGKAQACLSINSREGVQAVANDKNGFIPLIAAFTAITINIVVNPYLFALDLKAGQGESAIIRQLC